MPASPELTELCRRAKVSDYLRGRGVELHGAGSRLKCSCPLPGHQNDDTPSFYISVMPDGAEVFKCWGCGGVGNIITLVHLMENAPKHEVVRRLAASVGMEMGAWDPSAFSPREREAECSFCREDVVSMEIATLGREFLRANGGSEDAVNKISRVYQMADELARSGSGGTACRRWGVTGIDQVLASLKTMIRKYRDG